MEIAMMIIGFAIVAFLLWLFSRAENSPDNVGNYGEQLTADMLERGVAGEKRVLNDCRFRVGQGSVQIDHIVICKRGVFAVETKNWGGYLYGDDFREKWTQVYQYGEIKNRFYNPVLQNESHANVLSRILKGKFKVFPLVCLARFDGGKIDSSKVATLDEICGKINGFPEILTSEATERAFSLIKNALSDISDEEHVKNVKSFERKVREANICPVCKGKLILRRGSFGEFYGCQNFPKCKFTKNTGNFA